MRTELPVRDSLDAYARYLQGMDASMRQKVALTAAHLLGEGRVADMGMGSGAGSEALAALYPRLEVVGVDLDPTMVRLATERYRRPNLRFLAGDIAEPVFPDGSLDGIFDSSVLHHVTSFNGYQPERAAHALENQVRALRPHGVLVVRDFVDPGRGEVLLDLPEGDGDASDDPRRCSSAALFRRFSREFRSLAPSPGFPLEELDGAASGLRRFRTAHTLAAEFVLRKDYRADWEREAEEAYTYFTQAEFEALFARLGLRVLASVPLRNPWIVRYRFAGRFALWDAEGRPLEHPPTNYLIVGERVPPGEGVRFREAEDAGPPGFLERTCHCHRGSGRVLDLVRRPHLTVDVLPWFEEGGELFVLARRSFPRPLLAAEPGGSPRLCGSRPADYVTEPLNVLQADRPLGQTVEEALEERASIRPEQIRRVEPGLSYYPSPGGLQEEVRSVLVEIAPGFAQREAPHRCGFSTSGRVRAIEACQLLRAAQVGGLPDARLELNTYALLQARGRSAGPWIGEELTPREAPPPARRVGVEELAARPRRRAFLPAAPAESPGFLVARAARFVEEDAAGTAVAEGRRELVAPARLSTNTVCFALLRRCGAEILLGIDDEDRPAAQCFEGQSNLLVAPAYRLPREVATLSEARRWARERLRTEHGLALGELWDLGGRYHPSAGATPEVVYPLAAEVLGEEGGARPLLWTSLAALARSGALLPDGHLRVAAYRAAHALGLLDL